MDLKGKTALVTGASSGIGAAMAEQLAARKADLVLVARRTGKLEQLAGALRSAHGVEVHTLPLDLSEFEAGRRLFGLIREKKLSVDILINNAGAGSYGPACDLDEEVVAAQTRLNTATLAEACRLFGREMRRRGSGWILNVGSVVGFASVPHYAAYAADKAFVLHFSEALAAEMRGTGVSVSVLCPGTNQTAFFEVAGQRRLPLAMRITSMRPEKTAAIAVRGLMSGRRLIVPGWSNRLLIFLLRLAPRRVATAVAGRMVG